MPVDIQALRIDGIYRQNENNDLMLRIKIPGGLLSPPQAEAIAAISERFSRGTLHLTSRGSIEIHWLRVEMIEEVGRALAAVGLTSRGACGGAVRGVSCSTTVSPDFNVVQGLARRIHRHFCGNPHFEGLPKKFKISVDAGYSGARHLIQDAGIVFTGVEDGRERFDLWLAGGLGREPQPGFLYAENLTEERLLPLLENTITLYRQHTPAGKRLKHLLREIGEARLRDMLSETADLPALPTGRGIGLSLKLGLESPVQAAVFAGELSSHDLRTCADLARRFANDQLFVSADQNLLFFAQDDYAERLLRQELTALGYGGQRRDERVNFRICPGSHECRMGLSPTRLVARQILEQLPAGAENLTLAISGCPNSCSQPQLADIGIVTTALRGGGEEGRQPRFALYRRNGDAFGEAVAADLTAEELLTQLSRV